MPWKLEKGLSKEQMPDPEKPAVKDGLVPIDVAHLPTPSPRTPNPSFFLLWGPPEHPDEKRRVMVDLSADEITGKEHISPGFCLSPLDGYPAQTAITVWADKDGNRRYGGIWSTHGARSQVKPAYAGFELVDEPHWDMAVGPAEAQGLGGVLGRLLGVNDATGPYATIQRADTTIESKLVRLPLDDKFTAAITKLIDNHWRITVITPTLTPRPSPPTPHPSPLFLLHRPIISDALKELLALQQSAAAAALLKMGATNRVWPVFEHRPDPRVRSYLIHRLALHDVGPTFLLDRLADETEVSRRRALILSIGEYAGAKLLTPEQHTAAVRQLASWYADDPDPGIHGACEWALRKLEADEEIDKVRKALATGKVVGNRRWFITKTGQMTFAIVDSQEVFLMGSPIHEIERAGGATHKVEMRHRRRIARRYAVAMHEVTVEQFMQFREDHEFGQTATRASDAPANMISWYDAAAFCNWLSEREGIAGAEWCYDPEEGFAEGMVLPGDYLRRTGYRLLTEAEWEYACRAGAATSRYYGEATRLLGQYAWYTKNSLDRWMLPVGSLKPNDFGLFDMQGNAIEWCQEAIYYWKKEAGTIEDREQTGAVKNARTRVVRGGSFILTASLVRSAYRSMYRPYDWSRDIGFRVARTYP